MALEENNSAATMIVSSVKPPPPQLLQDDRGGEVIQQQSDWEMESVELDDSGGEGTESSVDRQVDQLLNGSLDYFEGVCTPGGMSGNTNPFIIVQSPDQSPAGLTRIELDEEPSPVVVLNGIGNDFAHDNLIVESVQVFENPESNLEENPFLDKRDDEDSEKVEVGRSKKLADRYSIESSSIESSESSQSPEWRLSDDRVLPGNDTVDDLQSEETLDEAKNNPVSFEDSNVYSSEELNLTAPSGNEDSAFAASDDKFCNRSDVAAASSEFEQTLSEEVAVEKCQTPQNISEPETLTEHDCLKNPIFVSLANDLEESRQLVTTLQDTVNRLENQLSIEKSQAERISLLEQRIAQQERELELSKQEHDLDLRTIATLRKEMDTKLDALKKQYEKANKDKEAMVMRYVTSEKELIDRKKEREVLEKKTKEQQKEIESLSSKLKNVTAEKTKVSQLLEQKTSESTTANKEIEKLKEEINSREIKIKWIQNRIKTEMDIHKECPEKIENLTAKVQQLEGELEEAKKEIMNLDKEQLENHFKKAFEQQLQEERAKLIVERHEHSERETKLKALQTKNQSLIEENNNLSVKVQNLEQERFDFEQKLIRAREDVRIYSQTVSELQSKIIQLDLLTNQLQQEKEKVETTSCELERLRKSNEELMSDMSLCRNREAEMLAFTQKLTTKNVQLQSEFSAVESKAALLDSEHQRAEEAMVSLKSRVKSLEREVKEEEARRQEEVRLMARQLAESATKVESLHASVEDYKGEISVLRNKHATTVRELQRELQQYKKKLDQYEAAGVGGSGNGSLCQGSRTSSLSSLNNEPAVQQTSHANNLQLEVAPQALVDRIVRLQHEIARQKERIEFLEDHSSQLTRELQKKSRLLQSYILREEAGALTSRSMDNNKAEVAKHGGIMASLYGSKLADDTMTLELSLEINHKLQAVLEDTLLKNITLKENIDTLGDEIARLTRQKNNN